MADHRTPRWQGKLNPKFWSDISDITDVTNRPVGELHQHTDAIIHAASRDYGDRVKSSIICPPDIYGSGRGPGRTRSVYLPMYMSEAKKFGRAFYAAEGENRRSWVHIEDLMKVYLFLIEAAVAGGSGADWGSDVCELPLSTEERADGLNGALSCLGILLRIEPGNLAKGICHCSRQDSHAARRDRGRRTTKRAGGPGRCHDQWVWYPENRKLFCVCELENAARPGFKAVWIPAVRTKSDGNHGGRFQGCTGQLTVISIVGVLWILPWPVNQYWTPRQARRRLRWYII